MADKDYKQSDFWAQKAKKEGYPARSIYKLDEIQKIYRIIPPSGTVIDVGSAPGSWTLYTSRNILKNKGTVVSVDLKPLELNPIPQNVKFFQGDAFSDEVLKELKSFGEYDAIISDAAPSTTGNRGVDTARSEDLVMSVLSLADECLKKGASCAIKLFQGSGEKEILTRLRSMFEKAVVYKPKACRGSSFEVYIIGLKKK